VRQRIEGFLVKVANKVLRVLGLELVP